ncbi:MAG TPA: hypothetical protein VLJ61_17800 [Pyrinomonadaceae bacterium]|nr:hypothetical protein [Pyrinomonadaceae bacterium]
MRKFTNPLDGVKVAAPCPADWEKMVGDERMRYCGECSLHVYNLSGMTKREAEALIANTEGRLCVRFYRRSDGTVLTRNCPVGLRALKRRATRIASATLTAVLGFFAGVGLNFGISRATVPPVVGEMYVPAPQRPDIDIPVAREDSTPPRDQGRIATVGMIAVRRADFTPSKQSDEKDRRNPTRTR